MAKFPLHDQSPPVKDYDLFNTYFSYPEVQRAANDLLKGRYKGRKIWIRKRRAVFATRTASGRPTRTAYTLFIGW